MVVGSGIYLSRNGQEWPSAVGLPPGSDEAGRKENGRRVENENKILSGWEENSEKGIAGEDRRGTDEKVDRGGEGNLYGGSFGSE